MRSSFILLATGVIFFGSGNAVETHMGQELLPEVVPSEKVVLSEVVTLDNTKKRSLRTYPVVDFTEDEEKTFSKFDDLIDVKKLDEAMGDTTKRKSLFKLWNADVGVSKQVIQRLSRDQLMFAKYNSLVLNYNVYRMQLASRLAAERVQTKTVDQLVNSKVLDAALKDRASATALFKQWNTDDSIAAQVISRISANPVAFKKYSELILKFNVYRSIPLRNAARNAANNKIWLN